MNRKLPRIQYLRGLAALSVVIYHVGQTYRLGLGAGAAGVDVFFMVSGFIMWVTTAGRTVTPATFAYRRIVRIVPVYWLATMATAIAVRYRPLFFFGHDASLSNLVRSLVFLPVLRNAWLHPVVIQGWTLSFEMFFYAIFAATLMLPARARLPAVTGSLIALAALHPLAPAGYSTNFTSPLLLEFGFGVVLGAWWQSGRRVPASVGWVLAAAGVVALVAGQMLAPLPLPRVVMLGIPSGLIVAGVVVWEMGGMPSEVRVLHFLGDASYSVYIWHVLAAVVATGVLLHLRVPMDVMPACVLVGAIGLTLIAYLTIERPLNRFFQLRRRETLSADAATAGTTALGVRLPALD